MDASRLTLISQVNNQFDYGVDCYPYQAANSMSPYVNDYSRNNNSWYIPSSSSSSCSPLSSSLINQSTPTLEHISASSPSLSPSCSSSAVATLSYGVPSFSPFLSSTLLDSFGDYSFNYGLNGLNNLGSIGSHGLGIASSYPIDDQQVMSASSNGSGHFTWETLSSPINYSQPATSSPISVPTPVPTNLAPVPALPSTVATTTPSSTSCWNSSDENEQIDRKPLANQWSGDYNEDSKDLQQQMFNRRNNYFTNNVPSVYEGGFCNTTGDVGRVVRGGVGGKGIMMNENPYNDDEYDEDDEDDDDEESEEGEDYEERDTSYNDDDERQLVIDTSASSIGKNDGSSEGERETDNTNVTKQCQVCGDKSTGRHYNAFTCEGCKGFFRRSVMKGMKYSCKSSSHDCKVDAANRRKCCRSCRFNRCIKIGMNPDICLNKTNGDILERSSRINCIDDMFTSLNSLYDLFLKGIMNNYLECGDSGGTCDQFYLSYVGFHFRVTNRLIYFESRLPPFTTLSAESRFIGIREAAHSIGILFILLHFDPESNSILWPNGERIIEEQLKGSVFSSIRFNMFQLAKELNRYNITEDGLPLMVLILLTLQFSREQFASNIISKCSSYKSSVTTFWNGHMELLHKVHNFIGVIKSALNSNSNNYSSIYNRDYNPIVHHHFPYPSQPNNF